MSTSDSPYIRDIERRLNEAVSQFKFALAKVMRTPTDESQRELRDAYSNCRVWQRVLHGAMLEARR